tara:strand:+ start:824 stop:1102 length:279 start_codon:yes stop_codon:yes gene_type:complete
MDEIDYDEVKEKGFIIEQMTLSNGSWLSVFEYQDLYYYFDEVQELGPFEDYEEIDEMLDKIENHVNNDPGNEIVDRQVKNVTNVSFFNHSKI